MSPAGARRVLAGAALIAVGTTGVVVAGLLSSDGERVASPLVAVGLPSRFEPDAVVEIAEAAPPIWVVRSNVYDGLDTIVALRGACPADGSRVIWASESRTFQCRDRTHRFATSGLPLSGSSNRALERYGVLLNEEGEVVVDPSRTFREELGRWADSESFFRLESGD